MYAIVDIETTGGSSRLERITEIAVYQYDGENITGEYSTLINPERNIPYFITNLTGITNEMVEDAPKFYEVARDIIELTEGRILIAHNARFDYSFIREEFRQLGYNYHRKLLDTVSLSKKFFPGFRSYSLGNICRDLKIIINDRHRAAGDALATVRLFELCLKKDREINGSRSSMISNTRISKLHPRLNLSKLENIPEDPGVYHFYDDTGTLIYIGKSRNLYERITSHLSNNSSNRSMQMRDEIADISWETTGSELIALLRESFEIKKNKPRFNKAQRRTSFQWGIFCNYDNEGYLIFRIELVKDNVSHLSVFTSKDKARTRMTRLVEAYKLCQKLSGLYESDGACFHHHVGICKGACCGKESPGDYNERAIKALDEFVFTRDNFFIIDSGRHNEERCAVKIMNGKFSGYGYFNTDDIGFGLQALHNCIVPYPDNRDVQVIIKSYLRNNRVERIIEF